MGGDRSDPERGGPRAPGEVSEPGGSGPRPASDRSRLVFEGLDDLAEELLSDRPGPSSGGSPGPELPRPDDSGERSLSQILDIYDAFRGGPPRSSAPAAEGQVPPPPPSEARTEVAAPRGVNASPPVDPAAREAVRREAERLRAARARLSAPAPSAPLEPATSSAPPARGASSSPGARQPDPPRPAPETLSRAQLEEAVAAARARRLEVAPRVRIEGDDAARLGVLVTAGAALVLGLLLYHALGAPPSAPNGEPAPVRAAPRSPEAETR